MPIEAAAKEIEKTGDIAATTTPADPSASQATAYNFGGKTYNSVDDLGKAYEAAQSELGRWTQQYGDLKKGYEDISSRAQQWDQWWKTVQPLWGDDVESLLRQKLNGGRSQGQRPTQQQQVSGEPDPFEGFDMLRPQEQYAKFRSMIGDELRKEYQNQLGQFAQAYQQDIGNREKWYQSYLTNHLSLMRRALEERIKDPNFDVDAVMQQAVQAIGGQIDPIQLGQQLLSAAQLQSKVDAAKKEAYEQGKKDFEQALANKQMETVPAAQSFSPVYKMQATPSGTRSGNGLASMRERAAEAIVKKFGPGIFTG